MSAAGERETEHVWAALSAMTAALGSRLVDRQDLVERLVVALLAGGHVLLEGAPGLAKTRAVKLFAEAVEARFGRIQCTPDLLPSDITGSMVFRQDTGRFEFVRGPVFHEILLVDEINRAPPKVQSALLEAMGERQVTVGGETHGLGDPFMVIATQNPIDHEGTYALPLAQLDRFLLQVVLPFPGYDAERAILDLGEAEEAGALRTSHPPPAAPHVTIDDLQAMRRARAGIHLSAAVKDYIVRLVLATRGEGAGGVAASSIEHPASPRATLGLAAAARARALVGQRDYVTPSDIRELAPDVMAHRIGLTWAAQAEGRTARSVIRDLVEAVPVV
jgi:MoxR-like ATPase